MRLIGSFHTITTHGRSSTGAVSPVGRSTSTGDGATGTAQVWPTSAGVPLAGSGSGTTSRSARTTDTADAHTRVAPRMWKPTMRAGTSANHWIQPSAAWARDTAR